MFKSLKYEEYRPYTCFQETKYPQPKTCGMANKIDGCSDKPEKIDRTRWRPALYIFFHNLCY